MEGDVRLDQLLDVRGFSHPIEDLRQLGLLLHVDAAGGQRRRGCLQNAPDLVELDLGLAQQEVTDEAGALEQLVRFEAADVSAVALAHLEHA